MGLPDLGRGPGWSGSFLSPAGSVEELDRIRHVLAGQRVFLFTPSASNNCTFERLRVRVPGRVPRKHTDRVGIVLAGAAFCKHPETKDTMTSPKDAKHAQMYGKAHRRLRAQWKVKVDAGNVRCWRCRHLIEPGSRWHLDHVPGTTDQYAGPAHPRCNEVGILPTTTTIVAHTPPPAGPVGRPTAEGRIRRALVAAGRPYERHAIEPVSVHDLVLADGSVIHRHGGIAQRIDPCKCGRTTP